MKDYTFKSTKQPSYPIYDVEVLLDGVNVDAISFYHNAKSKPTKEFIANRYQEKLWERELKEANMQFKRRIELAITTADVNIDLDAFYEEEAAEFYHQHGEWPKH